MFLLFFRPRGWQRPGGTHSSILRKRACGGNQPRVTTASQPPAPDQHVHMHTHTHTHTHTHALNLSHSISHLHDRKICLGKRTQCMFCKDGKIFPAWQCGIDIYEIWEICDQLLAMTMCFLFASYSNCYSKGRIVISIDKLNSSDWQ